MEKKIRPEFKSPVNIKQGSTVLAKSQLKIMSKKPRLKYYARLDGDTERQILQLKLMSKKQRVEFYAHLDEEGNKTKKRAALYGRSFIKNVDKKDRAKFYKNLDEKLKESFLKDYPDWESDIDNS